MSKIKVIAGDFEPAEGIWYRGSFRLWRRGTRPSKIAPSTPNITIRAADLRSLEIATEETVKRVGGATGWGAAGMVVAGPIGAVLGGIIGGLGKDITFVAEFRGGQKLLATVDAGTYKEILAAKGL